MRALQAQNLVSSFGDPPPIVLPSLLLLFPFTNDTPFFPAHNSISSAEFLEFLDRVPLGVLEQCLDNGMDAPLTEEKV